MTTTSPQAQRWVGQSVRRREDRSLLMGSATFTDDVVLPRMAHAAALASPYAHARIVRIDTTRAAALPGVYCVLTGKQASELCGPLPSFSAQPIVQHCIAIDRVRHVGEVVAVVAAESRYVAEDAIALIDVEYEPLPVISDFASALAATGDAVLHSGMESNVAARRHFKWGPVDEAFAEAAKVVRRRFRWPRVGPQPMETTGALVDFDASCSQYTIYSNMYSMQALLGAMFSMSLQVAPSQINFMPVSVGGSFGGRINNYYVPAIAAVLSRACGRPVKYIEDRLEHLSNGNQHASDREYEAALAVDSSGQFTALSLKVIDDYGAYMSHNLGSHGNALAQATGPYRIGALEYELTAVLSNKTQQAPYRGFGGEVGNFVLERLVDAAARELRVDPVELRRRNFIASDAFPYRLPHGNVYDSGNYTAVLDKALELADIPSWKAAKAEARRRGKRLGIGVTTVNERSVLSTTEMWFLDEKPAFQATSSPESVRMQLDMAGHVLVSIFAPHWGNSPETTVAQVTADCMALHPDQIFVKYAETQGALPSMGPAGSRYSVMVAGAVAGASRLLRQKMAAMAAHLLGAQPQDMTMKDGRIFVANDPQRGMGYGDLATAATFARLSFPKGDEFASGLSAEYTYDHPYTTAPKPDASDLGVFYPIVGHACHVAVVEVDEVTGHVTFPRYVAVHDAGTIVNPQLVNGQIRGGIAQGIGTALYEQYRYDSEGQLLNSSLADYLVPTAEEIPDIMIGHIQTPSPYTEQGMKGCGEGGRLAAMPAIAAAIDDAFAEEGLYVQELPVTPSVLHRLLHAAREGSA